MRPGDETVIKPQELTYERCANEFSSLSPSPFPLPSREGIFNPSPLWGRLSSLPAAWKGHPTKSVRERGESQNLYRRFE
jgi:hypothetical protein